MWLLEECDGCIAMLRMPYCKNSQAQSQRISGRLGQVQQPLFVNRSESENQSLVSDSWSIFDRSNKSIRLSFSHGAARVASDAGIEGGRISSGCHPNRKALAGPQTLPWHGPMPHRVWSFASRQLCAVANAERFTSSHRQITVSSRDNVAISSRTRNAVSRFRPKVTRRSRRR